MTRALCFLIFVVFAVQVHGLELEGGEVGTDPIRLKCTEDGLYACPRNCSMFIQCSDGIHHLMNCSAGLHFSNITKNCESVCNAQCDLTLACKCDWKSCGKEICFLPPKTGPCKASIPRYFFDKRDGLCKRFTYGGCNGNQNNFLTIEECEKQCGNVIDICKLPKQPGPCDVAIPRYYFNSKTGECEKFLYGCKGNANNFETKEQCDQKCLKKQEEEEADLEGYRCKEDGLYPNRRNCSSYIQCTNGRPVVMPCSIGLHFSVKTKTCEKPCDAHCDRTLACKCQWKTCGAASDICKLPKDAGPCKAIFPRWYYNVQTKKCEKFTYGGCQGNTNNFKTLADCEKRCPKNKEEEEVDVEDFKCPKDGLYPNRRSCSSYIECKNGKIVVKPCPSGLHYSNITKTCVSPCEAHCDKTLACKCEWKTCGTNLTCSLPPKTGHCFAHIPRYYFNRLTGICTRFVYGGCGGNENNFETKESCEKYCGRTIDICKLPREVGPCKALIPRWWYNAEAKKCEKFVYGGCQGNANNFETQEQCEHRCEIKLEEEEADLEVYRCRKDGLYRNSRNCSSYIQCTNGKPVVKPCPTGLQFSVKTKTCKKPCDAHCDRTLACKCQWKTCGTKASCNLPPRTGICRAHIPRYYFDRRSGVCKPFVYGGCGGNENNFESKEVCQKYCGSAMDICTLPKEVGPCKAAVPRWYYNEQAKKCEKFTYGGCQGNANNFLTLEDCEKRCPKKQGELSEEISEEIEISELLVCPEPNGDFPYHRNCKKFIMCKGGKPELKDCSPGQEFDFILRKCVPAGEAACAR